MTLTAAPPTDHEVSGTSTDHHGPKPLLRGWSHAVAFVVAVALCPIVIMTAPAGAAKASAAIFSGGTIALFGVSAAYHRFPWNGFWGTVMKRLDHSMIFIAIAATYTPIAVTALPDGPGGFILRFVWIGALIGVVFQVAWPTAPRLLLALTYVLVGWCVMLVIDDVWRSMGVAGFVLLLVGGLLHTIGAVIYATKRPDPWPGTFGFHEVFHLFVIAAVAVHYVAVTFTALH